MKLVICLLGRHIKCTPFAYPAYRAIFARYFTLTDDTTQADIVVMGLERNIHEHWQELAAGAAAKPGQKLLVVSEEPYWDLVLSRPGCDKYRQTTVEGHEFQYAVLSHSTTDIFDFEYLPYFITTQDHFIARYRLLFARNIQVSITTLLEQLQKTTFRIAMISEHRKGAKYAKSCLEAGLIGLIQFRTNLMEKLSGEDALIQGRGWNTKEMRQNLPDWHLDKLSLLDRNCRFISAIENTHQEHYVTEKFFDSLACMAVPVYFAKRSHSIFKLADEASYVRLARRDVVLAHEKIESFEFNQTFAKSYIDTQKHLNALMSDNVVLLKQRAYFASRFMDEIISS